MLRFHTLKTVGIATVERVVCSTYKLLLLAIPLFRELDSSFESVATPPSPGGLETELRTALVGKSLATAVAW